jgi:hypothetical protein
VTGTNSSLGSLWYRSRVSASGDGSVISIIQGAVSSGDLYKYSVCLPFTQVKRGDLRIRLAAGPKQTVPRAMKKTLLGRRFVSGSYGQRRR